MHLAVTSLAYARALPAGYRHRYVGKEQHRTTTPQPAQTFVAQLDAVLADYDSLVAAAKYNDLSDRPDADVQRVTSRARAAVEHVAGVKSAYAQQVLRILDGKDHRGTKANLIAGVVKALRSDVDAGYIQSIEELIHGDVFSAFLEMAAYLLDEHYKDAAAVIAGSTLEAHLRQLCDKHGVPTDHQAQGAVRPKKADQMNADLCKAGAYAKLDQKNVTAWLDLRNKAAHGLYAEYQKEQVQLLVSGIRDFMTRVPA